MSLNSLKVARAYLNMRQQSLNIAIHEAHIPHEVTLSETTDPSLSNRIVYGNRANWLASASQNAWFDCDVPTQLGVHRYLMPNALVKAATPPNQKNKIGMNLYE